VELGKFRDRSIKFLDRDQLDRLLNAPEISTPFGLRDKAILETLFSTGLRVSELTRLNRDQINLERREFGVIGKGGHARVVFLSEDSADWLKRYLDSRTDNLRPVFIRHSGEKVTEGTDPEKARLTPRSVERMVDKYAKKIRLPFRIGPHVLRHSFATDLLINGADLRSVQELLGHKNVGTTQIYTHVTNKQLREVHEAFHSRK
jgi:site-specific recombinase XerD